MSEFICDGSNLGVLNFNDNGTVTDVNGNSLSHFCCNSLASTMSGITYDQTTNSCRWTTPCETLQGYKVILPPLQDGEVLFSIEENQNCILNISFDYLLLFDCTTLLSCNTCENILDSFQNINLSATVQRRGDSPLDGISSNNGLIANNDNNIRSDRQNNNNQLLTTIYSHSFLDTTSNLGNYLTNNTNTGILLSGNNCSTIINCVLNALSADCSVVSATSFYSQWKHVEFSITDVSTLLQIRNTNISLGITINGSCNCNFTILLDNIRLDKVCQTTTKNEITINGSIGFELDKVIDNKKTWIYSESPQSRIYDMSTRETDYRVNDSRLIINTKDLDLALDAAHAIETDVYKFVNCNNECFLSHCITNRLPYVDPICNSVVEPCNSWVCPTGYELTGSGFGRDIYTCTLTASCATTVAINDLLSTPFSSLTNTQRFIDVIQSELIDVKNRKTLQAYPLLKYFFDAYLSPTDFACSGSSNAFDYCTMEKFVQSIKYQWVDLISDFVPSTSLWGATTIYRNTVFDSQKFNYRRGTIFVCSGTSTPCYISAYDNSVQVIISDNSPSSIINCITQDVVETTCAGVSCTEIDMGSSFIGTVSFLGNEGSGDDGGLTTINENFN